MFPVQKICILYAHVNLVEVLSVHQSTSPEGCEQAPLPEEVFISIGIDTGRICSTDSATLCEAATSNLHVFKIPLDK